MSKRGTRILVKSAVLFLTLWCSVGGWAAAADETDAFKSPEGLVAELYELVTFGPGTTPDWERVKSMFIDEAVIVLRTTKESTTIFSVEGFIEDFVSFIDRAKVDKTGFVERIVRTKPMILGDMAHILVLYEASIPGSSRAPQQGVDSFQLVKREGRWWIVSITNEIPTADRPVLADLRE